MARMMIHTGTKNKLSVLFHVTAATTWTQQSHPSAYADSDWKQKREADSDELTFLDPDDLNLGGME